MGRYIKILHKDINLIEIIIPIDKNLSARVIYGKYLGLLRRNRYRSNRNMHVRISLFSQTNRGSFNVSMHVYNFILRK